MTQALISHVFSDLDDNDRYQRGLAAILRCAQNTKSAFEQGYRKFSVLWGLLAELLNIRGQNLCYLVVDALDEVLDDNPSVLKNLNWEQILNDVPHLRVILLSRKDDTRISVYLKTAVNLTIQPEDVENDIKAYTEIQIKEHFNSCDSKFVARIRERVSNESDGIFLWAKLFLDGLVDSYSDMERAMVLENHPRGLMKAYHRYSMDRTRCLEPFPRQHRAQLLRILVGARRRLTISELHSSWRILNSWTPSIEQDLQKQRNEIESLCRPFVAFDADERVFLRHKSFRDFLLYPEPYPDPECCNPDYCNLDDSHRDIATICLRSLLQKPASSMGLIRSLIRKNMSQSTSTISWNEQDAINKMIREANLQLPYGYAIEHWDTHVTSIPSNDFSGAHHRSDLAVLLSQFLENLEFVTWSEMKYLAEGRSEFDTALRIRGKFRTWISLKEMTHNIPLQEYFYTPYRRAVELIETNQERDSQSVDYFLLLSRVADFSTWADRKPTEVCMWRKEISSGLHRLLGKANVLTVRAAQKLGQGLIITGSYDEAEKELRRILHFPNEVLEDLDRYDACMNLGLALYFQSRFQEAEVELRSAMAGFVDCKGPTYDQSLYCKLFLGWALDQQNTPDKLHEAKDLYESCGKIWIKIQNGEINTKNDVSLAATLRKLGKFSAAKKCLENALEVRQRKYAGNPEVIVFDSILLHAHIARDMQNHEEAASLLDQIKDATEWTFLETDFRRVCQIRHLEALLAEDNDNRAKAKHILEVTVQRFMREGQDNCREFLWVRLALARLREDCEPERVLELFRNLTERTLPEPGRGKLLNKDDLQTTRHALELVSRGRISESNFLLSGRGLSWVRPQLFWIMTGGPAVDTGFLPVQGQEQPLAEYQTSTTSDTSYVELKPPRVERTLSQVALDGYSFIRSYLPFMGISPFWRR